MKCVDTGEMVLFLEGQCEPERGAAIGSHVESCDDCAGLRNEISEIAGNLAPDPGELDDPALAGDIMTLIRLGQEPRINSSPEGASAARIWIPAALMAVAAIAALAIALPAIFSDQADKTHEPLLGFAARGGDGHPESRWASIRLFREAGGGYEPVEDSIARTDALAVAYENRDDNAFDYLMVFAVDDEGTVFWYYPAHQVEGENPTSVSIRRTDEPVQLPDAVTHELREGPMAIVGIFSHEPLEVDSVEEAVALSRATAGGTGIIGELAFEGTVCQRKMVEVVDSLEEEGR